MFGVTTEPVVLWLGKRGFLLNGKALEWIKCNQVLEKHLSVFHGTWCCIGTTQHFPGKMCITTPFL